MTMVPGSIAVGGGLLVVAFVLGLVILCLALFAFWIWMLVDAIRNPNLTSNERLAWVLVIVLIHFLGSLIYFIVSRTSTRRSSAPPPLPR